MMRVATRDAHLTAELIDPVELRVSMMRVATRDAHRLHGSTLYTTLESQ